MQILHDQTKVIFQLVNKKTERVEGVLAFNQEDLDMTGYVDHIEAEYNDTEWRVERTNLR